MADSLLQDWQRKGGRPLDTAEQQFVEEVALRGPRANMWQEGVGRRFERLELEGPPDAPVLVCHFRSEVDRPELPMALEWPLANRDALDYAVWMANLMELLDQAGTTLPRTPGPDGVARIRLY